jgi:rod shape-determining protein MreC
MKRVLTTLGMFALLCIVILMMDRRALLDPLREGLGEVFNPVVTRFEEIGRPDPSDSELAQQLATAQVENDSLRAENAQMRGQLEEAAVWQEQAGFVSERPDLTPLPARVQGRDPSGTQQIIIIGRGSSDGVRVGMAVTDPYNYVGQIVEVEENRSKVLLITDPSASVGAVLLETRGDGVVYGTRSSNGVLSMQHVAKDVVPGDQEWVVTSDLSESTTAQIPSHIPIGVVVGKPELNAQNDQLEIMVQPAADFQNLETVWIVVPND